MTARHPTPPIAPGRLRAAWRAAHAPLPGVPRWSTAVAYAIPFAVLPAGLWRIAAVVFHVVADGGEHGAGDLPSWLPIEVYVILLSVLSELIAFTAIGLIASWGENVPRWVPLLGGRPVPTSAVVVPAALGAVVLTTLWTATAISMFSGHTLQGAPLPDDFPTKALHGWELAAFYASYAPLLLWGPLLAVLCVAYSRRRARVVPTQAG
ncbi:hypothetical protein [Streptomyces sp. NPDC127098]|uniref:hypothetical protein n=1 Tax=Streptomyces sp. NPDC127098 TaxID=3347137 RepID=UPI00366556D7